MIRVICLGHIKERYLEDLISDYKKRISKYHKIEIVELKDSLDLEKEEASILNNIKPNDFVITLEIEGKNLSSEEFAKFLNDKFITNSNIVLVIGSSLGLSKRVKERSNFAWSFGNLTYPHGLFRGMLLEQIYRAFKIINNEKYHK